MKTKSKSLVVKQRYRLAQSDAHYAGNLVSGAKILEFFGDAATELLIRLDGDEGLFRAYEGVEFLAPVKAGDYIEVTATLVKKGNTSRKIKFEAHKVIQSTLNPTQPSECQILKKPLLTTAAVGICVVKK